MLKTVLLLLLAIAAACSGGDAGDTPTSSSAPASQPSAPATGSSASAPDTSTGTNDQPAPTGTPDDPDDPATADRAEACRQRREGLRTATSAPSFTELGRVVADDEAAGCAELCGPLIESLAAEDPCPLEPVEP